MLSIVNASKESSSEKINNIEHVLNPKIFIRFFTKEKCTYEEKRIQKILQHICALRNSGGGKLTIWLTETCSTRETEECAEIIINAAENVLSDTKRNDFKKSKCTNRLLMFFIKGSEEIVTMNYNMYIMENNDAKLVPSTKPAAEVRLFLQRQKGEAVPEGEECYFHPKNDEKSIESQTRQKSQPLKDSNVRQKIFEEKIGHYDEQDPKTLIQKEEQGRKRQKEEPCLRPEERVRANMVKDQTKPKEDGPSPRIEKRVYRKIVKDQTKAKELVARAEGYFHKTNPRFLPSFEHLLLQTTPLYAKKLVTKEQKIETQTIPITVNYKMLQDKPFHKCIAEYISPDVQELDGFHPSSKNPLPPVTLQQANNPKTKPNAKLLNQEEIVKGEKIKTLTTAVTVKFKMLKEKEFYSPPKSVADCLTQDEYDVRQYVSAFANHQGGELYYGIASDGTIHGERIKEIEIDDIQRKVEKKIESMVWPRHVDNIQKFWTICFLPVKQQEDADPRYVIKISVDRCPGGVFVTDPESYYVVRNSVVKLAFSMWIARLEGSSTAEMLDKTAYREFTGKINYINLNQINIHSPGGTTN